MKLKIIWPRTIANVIVFIFIHNVGAQQLSLPRYSAGNDEGDIKVWNSINIKAIRNFEKKYKVTENVNWIKSPDGFCAKSNIDGCILKAYFDHRGNWIFSVRTYNENKLPPAIRVLIRQTFYDYCILLTDELNIDCQPTCYIVTIEDDVSIKKINVCNGELTELKNFTK